ncbi:hypothetical protein Tco_0546835, partial [Tanacetum coccineum]
LSTSASGSQPSGNTRNDRIRQTPSSNLKNKVEAHPRNIISSLNKRNGTVKVNGYASVQNSKKQDNSDWVMETIRLGMLLFQGFIMLKDLGIIYFLWDNSVIPISKWLFVNTHASVAI